jgi:hypothetical protein
MHDPSLFGSSENVFLLSSETKLMNRRFRVFSSFSWQPVVGAGLVAASVLAPGCGGEPKKQETIQPEPIQSDAPLPDPKNEPVVPPGGP